MSAGGKPDLAIVGEEPALDMADDIYAKAKAEIARIDWSRVHIRSDRREPIEIGDRPKCKLLTRRRFSFEEK